MRILIVDDEQLDLFITKKLLSLEYEVEGFTSLDDTLNWARQNTFEVVLIDYYLGTGLYAHDALKQLHEVRGNTFKAFVLSNHVDDKQSQELRQAGFADIIYKPITLDKLKNCLNAS
ncbi:MAG: response regulator [Bacteroidota bacterium]